MEELVMGTPPILEHSPLIEWEDLAIGQQDTDCNFPQQIYPGLNGQLPQLKGNLTN